MRKRLRERLPLPIRLFFRGLIVQLVGKLAHLIGDLLNIAACNGLDLRRDVPWDVTTGLVKANLISPLPAIDDLHHQSEGAVGSLSPQDFLFLMETLSGVKASSSAQRIRTSIIIPVFGKLNYTFQCFRALVHEIDFQENEIIIINNGSPDETERVFSSLPALVRLINNQENVGFVHACNQGAAIARGKYLVFLNNDTVVQPGWLEHLVDTADSDSSVGAVGSKLLFPDGRLQEAGNIIWRDGTGWNYGRGKNSEERKYSYSREVDYCSGSSLLVRKNLFDELGGFDERYAPAYYEDADLCFGVRSLGFKVKYQPMSRLIHYEGVTAGTDILSGFKRGQEVNRERFVERWRSVLQQEHLENDPDQVEIAANRRGGPRVIVFDHEVPTPDRDSGSVRMSLILKSLSTWGRPVFVPVYQSAGKEYEARLEKQGVQISSISEYKEIIKSGDVYAAILSRAATADAVFSTVRKLDPSIKVIFDTVDLHHLRLEREYQLTGELKYAEESALLKKQETRLAALCDQVWCVTSEDKEYLQREVLRANIKVIPNIHPPQNRGREFDEREGLFFIANFNHRPNVDAVHYFVLKIFPLIQKAIPSAKFYIAGSYMPEEIKWYGSHNSAITTLGYVPDVDSIFHRARVFVAPLRYGSGMKGKVGQALSYGLPVVTTPIGAEGIGLRHEQESMIAHDQESFAEMVIKVYRHPELWQRLSDQGYKHIEKLYSPHIIEKNIFNVLSELTPQRHSVEFAGIDLGPVQEESFQVS